MKMNKATKLRYVCSNCGAIAHAWAGRCHSCGEWNTLQEELVINKNEIASSGQKLTAQSVTDLTGKAEKGRLKFGLGDIDEVLGGGIVPGSVCLIAGQPGIGKSTLLLQIAYLVANKQSVLYISGEESAHQIGLRASRLGTQHKNLHLVTSTSADDIATTIAESSYKLVIIDSIQSVICAAISSAAGSVSQITNSAALVTVAAKQSDTAIIMVGHVTKEGSIAGPKVLEHAVDIVLQLEGERYGGFKILRGLKNRFGSTNESAIFEMQGTGLVAVDNPSAALLAERQVTDGSVVLATMEGSRPILVEVQALVNKTNYGYPKRAASGFDLNRLNLLVAMLERRTKLQLGDHDIYVNIVGGIKISEPAADLAVCLAIGSAARGLQLKDNSVVFGEVGLSGEVRHVPYIDKRLAEAKKLGFNGAIGPRLIGSKRPANLFSVATVRDALNTYLKT